MKPRTILAQAAGLGLVLLTACSGCSQLPLVSKDTGQGETVAGPPPAEIVCIWQAAQGKGLNGMPARGVAGQLMFFSVADARPMQVEGDVRIYLFDDCGTPAEQGKPIHVFDVPADEWRARLTQGTLGPTYQCFIPYTRGGYEQVTCTLQVRLTPKNGRPVFSQMGSVTLPGPSGTAAGTEMPSSQPVSAPAGSSAASDRQSGLSVRSISPSQLAAEIRSANAAAAERGALAAPVAGGTVRLAEHVVAEPTPPVPSVVEEPEPAVAAPSAPRRRFRLGGASGDAAPATPLIGEVGATQDSPAAAGGAAASTRPRHPLASISE